MKAEFWKRLEETYMGIGFMDLSREVVVLKASKRQSWSEFHSMEKKIKDFINMDEEKLMLVSPLISN